MVKYQYQTLSIIPESLDETLNDKGNKGWRLVSIARKEIKISLHSTGYLYECVFEKVIILE